MMALPVVPAKEVSISRPVVVLVLVSSSVICDQLEPFQIRPQRVLVDSLIAKAIRSEEGSGLVAKAVRGTAAVRVASLVPLLAVQVAPFQVAHRQEGEEPQPQ